MKILTAQELWNRKEAGLQMLGEEEGELVWTGDKKQWQTFEELQELSWREANNPNLCQK